MLIFSQPCIEPGPGLSARLRKDPHADRQNEPAILRYWNECNWGDGSSDRMVPAKKCLDPGDRSTLQIVFRLVMEHQLIPFNCATQNSAR